MGWRKPVPRLTPEPSTSSQRPSRSALRRLSFTIINKDMPPLPVDWRESIETALKREKRHAVYVSRPPSPPPKDGAAYSRPESLAATLVEEQQDATSFEQPHIDSQPIQCVQRAQASPALARRPSQKSLPPIYRPPTPPLPAQHPKLRSAARSVGSSESVTNTLYNGLMSAERQRATPSPKPLTEKTPDAPRRRADAAGTARRASTCREVRGKQRAGESSSYTYRDSATSAATGSRLSGRSFLTSDVCSGVWYALKGWGLHVRAKMSHAGRY